MSVEGQGSTGNHAIKVDFDRQVGGSFNGAQVSVEVDWEVTSTGPDGQEPSRKPARFMVKPVSYRQASRSSARTLQLGLREGLTL